MTARAVYVAGQFDEQDWLELVRVLQRIESRHPEVTYELACSDPSTSVEEALSVMEKAQPLEGHEREYGVFKRR